MLQENLDMKGLSVSESPSVVIGCFLYANLNSASGGDRRQTEAEGGECYPANIAVISTDGC